MYNSDGNSFSISKNPNLAWFIQDNFALGGGVSVSFYSPKINSSNISSSVTSENKSTQLFAQFNFQYGVYGGTSNSSTSGGSSSETTTKPRGDWNKGLTFGYEHFVTPNVGLYASVGFNYVKSKTIYEYRPSTGTGYDYTSEYSRFYIPVNVGLQVHIPGKDKKK